MDTIGIYNFYNPWGDLFPQAGQRGEWLTQEPQQWAKEERYQERVCRMDCKTFELWLELALEMHQCLAGVDSFCDGGVVTLLPLGLAVASAGSFKLVT